MRAEKGTRGEVRLRVTRSLRSGQTSAEQALWTLLRDRKLKGFKFRRQHPIGSFIVDFYCPKRRLAIELDGGVHDAAEQHWRDQERDDLLRQFGVQVLRITNDILFHDPPTALKLIAEALASSRLP